MKRLGLPLVADGEWDEDAFEVQSLFSFHPELAFSLFFDVFIRKCENNPTVCEDPSVQWKFDANTEDDTLEIMKNLNLDKKLKAEVARDFAKFLKTKLPHDGEYQYEIKPFEFEPVHNAIYNYTGNNFKAIREKFFIESGFKNLDKLMVENYCTFLQQYGSNALARLGKRCVIEVFMVSHAIMKTFISRAIANVFTAAFLHKHQKAFIVYSFTKKEQNSIGTKRSFQRFEQCIRFLEDTKMRSALEGLLAVELFDEPAQNSAYSLAREALADIMSYLEEIKATLDDDVVRDAYRRLKRKSLMAIATDKASILEKVSDAFKDFKLDGSESLVELYVEMEKFNSSIEVFDVAGDFTEQVAKIEDSYELCKWKHHSNLEFTYFFVHPQTFPSNTQSTRVSIRIDRDSSTQHFFTKKL